ncbi:MAG: NAD(P)H-dependent oxidoreductase [Acidobacteriota bacterium]|nr:NAD(P)H-dependent oxidoreductase [Acidobacteriota bacterium]
MATVVLSAASAERPALQRLAAVLAAELERTGETDVRTFDLAKTKLAYCQGEFDCWVRTPGLCRAHDAEQEIVQALHDADRLVMLDEITFGGHSYTVKRAQDRIICLISPFFEKRAALTHHEARYERMPSLFKLGWMPRVDPAAARTWSELADANAVNLFSPHVGAAAVDDAGRERWPEEVRTLLASTATPGANIVSRGPLREALMAAAAGEPSGRRPEAPRTAALVVGSAKAKGLSVSQNLASALSARLRAAGVTTRIHAAIEFLHEEPARSAAKAVAEADLLVLVTPLYVDAFPALATSALEHIAAARRESAAAAQCAAIVNCGFPEPEHTRTALRVARHFASAAGYGWAGGLPLGGGGAIDAATPLDEQHGPARHVQQALDSAASCLARGAAVAAEAVERMAASPMPDAVYRFIGDMGWRYQVYQNGLTQSALRARPLD